MVMPEIPWLSPLSFGQYIFIPVFHLADEAFVVCLFIVYKWLFLFVGK